MKVAIASGKGGTGKTTVATNLAVCLAEREPVVLADLDVEEPNSGLFVQGDLLRQDVKNKMIPQWAPDECTHCGICQAVCNFNAILSFPAQVMVFPELCHSCYACSELCPSGSLPMVPRPMGELRHFKAGALDFVESRLTVGEEQAVPLIAQTLAYLDHEFPPATIELLDSPPGTSCPVIEVMRQADLVLLVTDPTPFGLHDLKLAVATVRQLGRDFGVVLNRDGLGDGRVARYCEDEQIDVVARIPHRRHIAEVYASGGLLYPGVPEVREAMAQVAAHILSRRIEVRS